MLTTELRARPTALAVLALAVFLLLVTSGCRLPEGGHATTQRGYDRGGRAVFLWNEGSRRGRGRECD